MTEASPQTRPVLPCSDWDTRKHRHYVPISVRVLKEFLEAGFILKEDIIKLQHKMMMTRQGWKGKSYDFYLIGHQHLYVFRKAGEGEKTGKLKMRMEF